MDVLISYTMLVLVQVNKLREGVIYTCFLFQIKNLSQKGEKSRAFLCMGFQ